MLNMNGNAQLMKPTASVIESIWQSRGQATAEEHLPIVHEVIAALDRGELRVAEPFRNNWRINEWIKKAILLYFQLKGMETVHAGVMEFHDKIPLKTDYSRLGIRAVPHAVARFGSYIAPGVILMPSYINIGAWVGSGTMVDTWATVGSCAQIGKNVHLSGGVGIGGVLEPLQASPVIIEDDCFIGSRSIIVEGALVEKGAVIGANVVITGSTRIIDVTGDEEVIYRGRVPQNSVVIPGSYTRSFPAGEYQVPCALIIGKRKKSTDKKTSLNEVLRRYRVDA